MEPGSQPVVGFVGLGNMGAPMARKIIEAGFPSVLWARRTDALEPFLSLPTRIAGSLEELGSSATVVCVCVVDDDDVNDVVLGPQGVLAAMAPGGTILIHSTVHPDTCVEIGREAEPHGVGVLDAPVSGGAPAAAAGRLAVMVGGEAEHFARAGAVLRSFGDPVVHVGPLGSGEITKLINNSLYVVNLAVAGEALRLGAGLGLDRRLLWDVISRGSGGSFALSLLGQSLLGQMPGLAGPNRGGSLLQKDVALLRRVVEGDRTGGHPLTDLATQALAMMETAQR